MTTTEGSDHWDEDRRRRREQREAWREERRREREARRRERKERILHTRISEDLAQDIRRVAEQLRVPVSNLVRNVLDEAFSAVEYVSDNVGDLVEDIVDEAERAQRRLRRRRRHHGRRHPFHAEPSDDVEPAAPGEGDAADASAGTRAEPGRERPEFQDVVGWQPMLLNREQTCADCGRTLRRGERAFRGLTELGQSPTTLCRTCVNERD